MKRLISVTLSAAMIISCASLPASAADEKKTETVTYRYDNGNWVHTREMEKLGRGLVAIKSGSDVYLSWRLLDSEDAIFGSAEKNVTFNVYQGNTLIDTVTDKTNYTVYGGDINAAYSVAPVINGVEGEKSAAIKNMENSYFDIPVDRPSAATLADESTAEYTLNDASCGDLDGDGEYEIIVKWDANGKDNSQGGYTGNVLIDAYKLNGTKLWRIDLGPNIRAGAHYTQFLVYDFDGDGKAEMTCKTAPGSVDSEGKFVTKASKDDEIASITDDINNTNYTNSSGYILDGDEYLTIFNGRTGKAIDTIYYPNQRVETHIWGDRHKNGQGLPEAGGNRVDRYTATVAYMDGVKPYAVYMRGYYMCQNGGDSERQAACAVSFDGNRLECTHSFDTYDVNSYDDDRYGGKKNSSSYRADGSYKGVDGYAKGNEKYVGEGNHNCSTADVDGDGKDEVMTGALCYEFKDDGTLGVKWCTFLEHGDALHIGDYDPTHEGFEFFTVHEDSGPNKLTGTAIGYGLSVIDPAINLTDPTDTETWNKLVMLHSTLPADTGRGLMANVGMGGYYQVHGSAGSAAANNVMYIAYGNNTFTQTSTSIGTNFRVFWDGDLYDEILDGTNISSWNTSTNKYQNILNASTYGCTSINDTKANPALQADLFGDWREEVVYPLSTNTALRVFSTTTPSNYKIKTLMQDPVYRSGVAAEQTAYNQPPHVGMYLADSVFEGTLERIEVENNISEYEIGSKPGIYNFRVTAYYDTGIEKQVDDYTISGCNPYATGEQTITISYGGKTATTKITYKNNFTINDDGYITGYTDNKNIETLPVIINGKLVKGIASGALENSSIVNLSIYNDILFAENALKPSMVIQCYENSTAHKYATASNIEYRFLTDDGYTNLTFDDTMYQMYSEIANGTTSTKIGDVTYTPGIRSNKGQKSNAAAIARATSGSNSYLSISATRFAYNDRHAYMTLGSYPILTQNDRYRFSTDFYIQANTKGLSLALSDANDSLITSLSVGSPSVIAADTWYKLTLDYKDGNYTQTISAMDGTVLQTSQLSGGNGAVKTIACPITDEVNETNYIYLDNISATAPFDSTVTLNITDSLGTVVSNATIVIDGVTKKTDANGVVTFDNLESGAYSVTITADQLGTCTKTLNVYTENQTSLLSTDKHYPLPVTENPVIAYTELSSGAQVSISCETAGASIYYTTDGTEPTTDSTLYSGAFMVYEPATVKAIAVKAGLDNSEVVTKAIQISARSIAPVINITPSGEGKIVTLTTETNGADIYYTLDDSMPSTETSTKYESPITVSDTKTIKAVAYKTGDLLSPVSTATITIEKAAAPAADTAAGTVDYGKLISLSTATASADIYYTTDGSAPTKSSTKYTGSIALTANTTIKAITVKDGYKNSEVFEAAYTVSGEASTDSILFSVGSTISTDGTVSVPVYAAFDSDEIDTRAYTICLDYDRRIFEYVSVTPKNNYDTIHAADYEGEVEVTYNNIFDPGLLFTVNFKPKDDAPDGVYTIGINMEGSEIKTYQNCPSEAENGTVTLNRSQTSAKVETSITNANGNAITTTENLEEFTANVVVEDPDTVPATEQISIIIAVYDRQGALVMANLSVVNSDDLSSVYSSTLPVPEGAEVGSIKLMMWKGLDNPTPLSGVSKLLGN